MELMTKLGMLATLILPLALPACARINAATSHQKIIDTSPEALREWLDESGHKGALITGRRNEDCAENDLVGYGVIIKKQVNGQPVATSAVVCQNFEGAMRLKEDL